MYVNGKNDTFDTIPRMGRGGDKGGWWRGAFKYDIFDIL
jgi:hypothetical protein